MLASPGRAGKTPFECPKPFEGGAADVGRIRSEFRAKAEFKRLDPGALVETIERKEKALAALWERRLANQWSVLPPFGTAFKRVLREARKLIEK